MARSHHVPVLYSCSFYACFRSTSNHVFHITVAASFLLFMVLTHMLLIRYLYPGMLP